MERELGGLRLDDRRLLISKFEFRNVDSLPYAFLTLFGIIATIKLKEYKASASTVLY
jgi:hypothetical protein